MGEDVTLSKLSKKELIVLLKLPRHLQKTMISVFALSEVTATMVAERTGRARAVESSYLNQLERMGYLKRWRKGRVVYFAVSTP